MSRTYYRPSRNLETSIIEKLRNILIENSWRNTNVEKIFAKVYTTEDCTILVTINDTNFIPVEVGSNTTQRIVQVIYDIYATNDGQLLDLKDILMDSLKHSIPYYEYVINKEVAQDADIEAKARNGTLSPQFPITDTSINRNIENKSEIRVKDRYRWRITVSYKWSKSEV